MRLDKSIQCTNKAQHIFTLLNKEEIPTFWLFKNIFNFFLLYCHLFLLTFSFFLSLAYKWFYWWFIPPPFTILSLPVFLKSLTITPFSTITELNLYTH
jgi:hypothetical protein